MKVGDLVRVMYDGTVGVVARVEPGVSETPWIWLHNGESFRSDYLELVNESA